VAEYDDEFVVMADLPGYDREDIDVRATEGRLTITAEHDAASEDADRRYLRRERRHESVTRSVDLPGPVVDEDASATYRHGVLTITLPRRLPTRRTTATGSTWRKSVIRFCALPVFFAPCRQLLHTPHDMITHGRRRPRRGPPRACRRTPPPERYRRANARGDRVGPATRVRPERHRSRAYADRPLPIGHDQTVSAPHMVALMTDLLDIEPGDRVFEVGTGCGYHAAVVAEIVGPGNVYSVEYVPELAESARKRLRQLGYDVTVWAGDGQIAFRDEAPFDVAYLTCAPADGVPDSIVDRVQTGGRVVAPVGRVGAQRLVRLTVKEEGVEREDHGGVRFVPMR